MALSATLYRFQIELSDIDRNVYESIDLRVACHPSEDAQRMIVRVLARLIAHREGLDFGRGLSTPEDPALWTRSPVGDVDLWIDVGLPSAERLHRASKRAGEVMVFTDKSELALRKEWSSRKVHRAEALQIVQVPAALTAALAEAVDRSQQWYLTLQDGMASVSVGDSNFSGQLQRSSLAEFMA